MVAEQGARGLCVLLGLKVGLQDGEGVRRGCRVARERAGLMEVGVGVEGRSGEGGHSEVGFRVPECPCRAVEAGQALGEQ